jgi:VWFA-related protein
MRAKSALSLAGTMGNYALLLLFIFLLGEGMVAGWKGASPMKWAVTLFTIAFFLLLIFGMGTRKLSIVVSCWASFISLLLLVLLSTYLYGTSSEVGYSLLGLPTSFIMDILLAIIVVALLWALLLKIEVHRIIKFLLAAFLLYCLCGIVQAMILRESIEGAFNGLGILSRIPYFIRPMFLLIFILLPLLTLCLSAFIVKKMVARSPPSVTSVWTFISLIIILLIGINTFLQSCYPDVTVREKDFASLRGRVNVLSPWQGGQVVTFSTQIDATNNAACNLNDGKMGFHSDGAGWSSKALAPFPHEITFALAGEKAPKPDQIVLYNADPAKKQGARECELLGASSPSSEFQILGRFSAKNSTEAQVFKIKPMEIRLLKLRILSNWGDKSITSVDEVEAWGAIEHGPAPQNPSENLLSDEKGSHVLVKRDADETISGEDCLIKKEEGGSFTISGKLPRDITISCARGESSLVNRLLLTFPGEGKGIKEFEVFVSSAGPSSGWKRVGRYSHRTGDREMMVTFRPALASHIKVRVTSLHPGKAAEIGRIMAFQPPLREAEEKRDYRQGLLGFYYNGLTFRDFCGERIDPALSFNWTTTQPIEGVKGKKFFVHWKGALKVPEDGLYELSFNAADGFSLVLDGRCILENWKSTPGRETSTMIALRRGFHPLALSHYNSENNAFLQMRWRRVNAHGLSVVPKGAFFHDPTARDAWLSRSPRGAAQAGIDWLSSNAIAWQRMNKCYGCHVQTQALMGLSISRKNSYRVAPESIATLESFLAMGIDREGNLCFRSSNNTTSFQFLGMALAYCDENAGTPNKDNLIKLADQLLSRQDRNGSIPMDLEEPPIEQGTMMSTTNSLLCFRRAYEHTGDKKYQEALRRGGEWLRNAHGETTQDLVFQILGLATVDPAGSKDTLRQCTKELYGLQHNDGGWGEIPAKESNNYATGQALYALKVSGASIADERFMKGVNYLMGNQQVFGSWPSVNSQSQRPSDYAPTMWAVIGLAGSFEKFLVSIESPREQDRFSISAGEERIVAKVFNFSGQEIKDVQFSIDGKLLGTLSAPPFTMPWKPSEYRPGPHTIRVAGKNREGLESRDAREIVLTGRLTLEITVPKPDEVCAGTITLNSRVQNDTGSPTKKVEYFIDGKSVGTTTTAPFNLEWKAVSVPPGTHVLRALAENEKSDVASAQTRFMTEQGLKLELTTPEEGALLDEKVTAESRIKNMTGEAVRKVEYFIEKRSIGSSAAAPYSVQGDLASFTDGAYMLRGIAETESGETAEDLRRIEICHPFTVTFWATVTDSCGRFIVNLTKADFAVMENNSPQSDIKVTKTTEETPVSVVMLLDGSGSMAGTTRDVISAADTFIALLSPKDRAAVLFFDDRVGIACPFTKDRRELSRAISHLQAAGGTALYDSIYEASGMVKGSNGRKAIILLTDGVDENAPGTAAGSSRSFAESLRAARESDCVIYSIGLGKGVDDKVLRNLSESTGGRLYLRPGAKDLQETYRQIAEELRCQYIISYRSSMKKRDGAWRKVKITTPGNTYKVRTKEGYFAPKY